MDNGEVLTQELEVQAIADSVTGRYVRTMEILPGTKINGAEIGRTWGYGDRGDKWLTENPSTWGHKSDGALKLTRTVEKYEGSKNDALVLSQWDQVDPNKQDSVIVGIGGHQQRSVKGDWGGDVSFFLYTELPRSQAQRLMQLVKDKPDLVEEFYQATFKGLDAEVGSDIGLRRYQTDRLVVVEAEGPKALQLSKKVGVRDRAMSPGQAAPEALREAAIIPSWYPEDMKAEVLKYQPEAQVHIIPEVGKAMDRYLDRFFKFLDAPEGSKDFLSIKQRNDVVKFLNITENELKDYKGLKESLELNLTAENQNQFKGVFENLKKVILTKFWNATIPHWENVVAQREKEWKEWIRVKEAGGTKGYLLFNNFEREKADFYAQYLFKNLGLVNLSDTLASFPGIVKDLHFKYHPSLLNQVKDSQSFVPSQTGDPGDSPSWN